MTKAYRRIHRVMPYVARDFAAPLITIPVQRIVKAGVSGYTVVPPDMARPAIPAFRTVHMAALVAPRG